MEKIKNILSHGQEKEGDAAQGRHDTPTTAEFDRSKMGGLAGEGSPSTGTNKSTGVSGEHHPIYDQFAKGTEHTPQLSNTPNVSQPSSTSAAPSTAPSHPPSLHPNQFRPGPNESMSNASIKSGVIGFPQGAEDTHAARPNNNPFEQNQLGSNQPGAGGDLTGTKADGQGSRLQQGVSAGTGALGAGALAEHGSRTQPEDSSYISAGKPPQINLQRQESEVPPDSGRSFPLAGGVAHQTPQTGTGTSARQPGTKEREAGLSEGQGREGLAGAAAAAAATSAVPQNDGSIETNLQDRTVEQQSAPEHHYGRDAAVGGGLGAAGVGAYEAAKHHHTQTSQPTSQYANPEALAGARAAADEHGWTHTHDGRGHQYGGDPCDTHHEKSPGDRGLLFTSGPHATDTANRTDPKLHIPGEFPSPTPLEESNASSYLQSKPTTETNPSAFGEPELRHTGSLDEPQARSVGQPTSEHHHGRDAAIAGGLGVAGAGAYAAGKHHEKESADVGSDIFPDEPNPYTHTRVDPRVDSTPRGGFSEQRYDPTTSETRSPRNAALTGGAIGSSRPATQEAPGSRELSNKEYPLAGQDVKSDSQHHYGRDAALVGAGAATTAGLYASQRDAEPDSGPASSTVGPHKSNVANVLDPRVQPDPELQKHHHAAPTVEDPAPSTVGPHKSDVANIVDPRVLPDQQKQKAVPEEEARKQQHHYGRDAAVAGGAGAAGYGAYEVAKSYGEHPSTQPSASMNEQRYDPSARGAHAPGSTGTTTASATPSQDQHHYGRDAAVVGGLGTAGAGAYAANRDHQLEHTQAISRGHDLDEQRYDPSSSSQQASVPQSQHHYGRDAAVGGGAGALGAGAYAATRDHSQPQQSSVAQGYQQPSTAPYSQNQSQTGSYPPQDPSQKEDHTKRNAALGTGAVAAAGAGAYGLSQHDAQKEHEHQLKEQQKAFEEQQKASQKASQKAAAADQKHHDKLVAAAEKKHAKEAEHKEREHAKELDKREREREQQAASTTFMVPAGQREYPDGSPEAEGNKSPHGKEKKHRIFTFLNKKDKDSSRSGSGETSPRGSRDSPRHSKEYAAGAVGVGAAGAGLAAADHDEHEGRYLAEKKGRSVLHKEPPANHPAYDTHTHEPVGKREHIGIDGPIGDPNFVSGDQQTRSHTVTEPRTGLPMNTEKYGDGHGGTDGSSTIPGVHLGEGQATDWDAIKKKDTLF
ncbi:hypothetical protein P171DRAFT_487110 [Karstenula rhodostoma CBS 690.94]|uniref:Uncharacterized protein n=1 Tax=Karstenula rhodostoma CBS 690.94 TaxID=1392251 RepID=A0A9P4PFV6_9PLEO|nr:hypothetical protein P171DRAFT_487110 [Karstenula rhodostoma CBS 690.94]